MKNKKLFLPRFRGEKMFDSVRTKIDSTPFKIDKINIPPFENNVLISNFDKQHSKIFVENKSRSNNKKNDNRLNSATTLFRKSNVNT
jgi:hypothetical protein